MVLDCTGEGKIGAQSILGPQGKGARILLCYLGVVSFTTTFKRNATTLTILAMVDNVKSEVGSK